MWGWEEKAENSEIDVVLVTGSMVASNDKVFTFFLLAGLDLPVEIWNFL